MMDTRNRFRVVNSIYEGMQQSKRTIVLSENTRMSLYKMDLFIDSIPISVNYKAIRGDMKVELMGVEVLFKSKPEQTWGIDREASIYFYEH